MAVRLREAHRDLKLSDAWSRMSRSAQASPDRPTSHASS